MMASAWTADPERGISGFSGFSGLLGLPGSSGSSGSATALMVTVTWALMPSWSEVRNCIPAPPLALALPREEAPFGIPEERAAFASVKSSSDVLRTAVMVTF